MLDGKPLVKKMESGASQFGKLTTCKDLPARSKLLKLVKDAAKLNEAGVTMGTPTSCGGETRSGSG